MTTQLQPVQPAESLDIFLLSDQSLPAAKADILWRTVCANSTRDEFEMFMYLAKAYGLDPFRKEIFFVKYVPKSADPMRVAGNIIVGRDGLLKIAQRSGEFEGIDGDVVRQADTMRRVKGGVEHTYGDGDRGPIVGAWAIAYRKGCIPTYFYAPISEYRADFNPVWKKYESAMILKCAESTVLRKAFNITGLTGEEEISRQHADETAHTSAVLIDEPRQALPPLPLTAQTRDRVLSLLRNDDVIGPMEEEAFRAALATADEAAGLQLVATIKALIDSRTPAQ